MHVVLTEISKLECYCYSAWVSTFKFNIIVDSWLVAVHKKTYTVRQQVRGLPSADIFRTGRGSYSDADVCTFCCKKHRIFQNL